MLSVILGAVTGLAGPISQVINNITDLRKRQTEAKTDVEKARIQAEIDALQERKALLLGQVGNRIVAIMYGTVTVALSVPAITILWKFAYDKVVAPFVGCRGVRAIAEQACASFATDPLSTELTTLVAATIVFFLGAMALNRK